MITRALRILAAMAGVLAFQASTAASEVFTTVYVELERPAPVAAARWQASREGRAFDANLHRAAIRLAQQEFLARLTADGVSYASTSTAFVAAGREIPIPNRYAEVVNAVRLVVAGPDVARVRAVANVKHITVEEPAYLNLDNSVAYIRANGPSSARSAGFRGTGQVRPNGTASGQVIAILDSGIDATNPMLDTTKTDAQFEQRSGDFSPVRVGGEPYVPGIHHPKVIYRAHFSGQPTLGDDDGHGTQNATTAAGLKALTHTNAIVEGVAPGALLMDYKICPSLVCASELILASFEDAPKDTDPLGNPKPKPTVLSMSFGNCGGDPQSINAVASGNLQFEGIVPTASAGNLDSVRALLCDDHIENTMGTPAAGRRVIAVGASLDPGVFWGLDVLDPSGVERASEGAVVPASGLAAAEGQRRGINLFPMAGTPAPPPGSMAQYYVFVQDGRTPAQWPENARGRIGLVRPVSPATFAQVVNSGAAVGAAAVVFISNTQSPTAVAAPIPGANVAVADGEYLIDLISSTDDDSVDPPSGTLSEFPIRINAGNAAGFVPDTAGFSARGPNNDFAVVKPDVLAPGANILMGTARVENINGFAPNSGTSFSNPHVAGAAALVRDPDFGRPSFSPSQVRAALMNSATNLREGDGTPIPDSDDRNFLHETGAGLVDLVAATRVLGLMGTNELNGPGGPDDPSHPDFLPSHSLGLRRWIGTELSAAHPRQRATTTVTLADLSGGGGRYTLSIVDAGAFRGDITRPIDTPGFVLSLGATSVVVPANGRATFDVTVAVDGTAAGVPIAGADDDGLEGTDFAWFVVARRDEGAETLRMPFYLRAARGVIGGGPVGAASGGGWIPASDGRKSNFGFNAEATTPPSGHLTYDASQHGIKVHGRVTSVVASGTSATFEGDCTLGTAEACSYEAEVQDNAEPGKGADRFRIRVYDSGGMLIHEADSLLGGGNVKVKEAS